MEKKTSIADIIKSTFKGWMAHDPFKQSAVIAYYAIFSLPALLVLIINVIGFFFAQDVVNTEISRQIAGVMGEETAKDISKIIQNANHVKAGLLPGIIAVVLLISGATGVFVQLQTVLNEIWGVKQKSAGIMLTIKNRIFSFGLILSIGFLLLVSLVVSSLLATASHWIEGVLSTDIAYLMYAIEFIVSLSVISLLFALMFKFLPDVKIAWKDVWAGAIATGFLFILGKYGLSFYFGKANPGSVYGAAGSIVLMLLWVSYSSMIVFFGAQFTRQYALAKGAKFSASPNAEVIDPDNSEHLIAAREPREPNPITMRRTVRKLKNTEELERETDKLSLQLVVRKVQIKDMIVNLFKFRKKAKPHYGH
ncbi:MAG: YihY/virulence factor BrkB family protein [Bacteroidota bacterium]